MAKNIKAKEIKVQKAAQSLQAFQQNLDGPSLEVGQVAKWGGGAAAILLAAGLGWWGFSLSQDRAVERFEIRQSEILRNLRSEDGKPLPPDKLEAKIKEALPEYEKLAQSAPRSLRPQAQAQCAAWKLMLEGKGTTGIQDASPWGILARAQNFIALGKAQEAQVQLEGLLPKAQPTEAWASLYWKTLLELDQLQGNREKALQHLSEYKARFKEKGDTATLENMVKAI